MEEYVKGLLRPHGGEGMWYCTPIISISSSELQKLLQRYFSPCLNYPTISSFRRQGTVDLAPGPVYGRRVYLETVGKMRGGLPPCCTIQRSSLCNRLSLGLASSVLRSERCLWKRATPCSILLFSEGPYLTGLKLPYTMVLVVHTLDCDISDLSL
ncbi:hypothetical protein BJV74DRAFT_31244 [Russula compacta]|nr:hypothetical protein BJV74DRAFT_31244 [Russula compacta]